MGLWQDYNHHFSFLMYKTKITPKIISYLGSTSIFRSRGSKPTCFSSCLIYRWTKAWKTILSQWRNWGRSLHRATRWIRDTWEGVSCVQVEESPVWTKASTSCMVWEDWWILDEFGLQQECCWSKPILQHCWWRVPDFWSYMIQKALLLNASVH